MDLALNGTEGLLIETARRLLGPHRTVAALSAAEDSVGGVDGDLWARMVDAGWTGLAFGADRGGGGGDVVMLGLLAVEIGRAGVASPLLATVAAGVVADRLGDTEAAVDLVERVAAGTCRAALVAPAAPARSPVAAGDEVSGGPWVVEWGAGADVVVVPARREPGKWSVLAIARHDLAVEPVASTDNERIALVSAERCRGAPLTSTAVGDEALEDALAVGALLRAAALVGTAERALELTVAHVREREQFGQPLGRFQAVQHRCADVAIHADGARLALLCALTRASRSLPFTADAAVACYVAARAAEIAVIEAAQLHGGIGFMKEYELSFHFRRAKAGQLRLGGELALLEAVAARLPQLMAAGWEGRA